MHTDHSWTGFMHLESLKVKEWPVGLVSTRKNVH